MESARLARAARNLAGDSLRARRCCMRSRFTCRPSAARCRSCVWSCSRCRTGWPMDRPSSRRWRRFLAERPRRRALRLPRGDCATRASIGRRAPTRGGSQRAHRRSCQRPCRLPAPDGGRQARRGGTEAGAVEAHARRAESAPKVISCGSPYSSAVATPGLAGRVTASISGRSGCMVKESAEPTRITPIETIKGSSQLPVLWIK